MRPLRARIDLMCARIDLTVNRLRLPSQQVSTLPHERFRQASLEYLSYRMSHSVHSLFCVSRLGHLLFPVNSPCNEPGGQRDLPQVRYCVRQGHELARDILHNGSGESPSWQTGQNRQGGNAIGGCGPYSLH